MNVNTFVNLLGEISLPNVFNPYRDSCCEHDHAGSPTIRRSNLQLYLEAAIACEVDSVWLGRDCGYRGARRTGIALTDEIHLETLERHFGIDGIVVRAQRFGAGRRRGLEYQMIWALRRDGARLIDARRARDCSERVAERPAQS